MYVDFEQQFFQLKEEILSLIVLYLYDIKPWFLLSA